MKEKTVVVKVTVSIEEMSTQTYNQNKVTARDERSITGEFDLKEIKRRTTKIIRDVKQSVIDDLDAAIDSEEEQEELEA